MWAGRLSLWERKSAGSLGELSRRFSWRGRNSVVNFRELFTSIAFNVLAVNVLAFNEVSNLLKTCERRKK